jgi:hypothetical protein
MEAVYSDLNVKHFKLTSGDEILGLIAGIDTKNGILHIEYPVLLDMIGNNYMMNDYMPTSLNNIVAFGTHNIIAQSDVHDSVKQEYVKYCTGVSDKDDHDHDPFDELMDAVEQVKAGKVTYH